MAARIEWVVDPVTAWMPNYIQWTKDITEVVEDVMAARAQEVEDWMKANHKWRNRTTLAEQRLFTAIVRDGTLVALVMGHGTEVFYSRFLERYMAGGAGDRFSVLKPAMDYWGPIILDDIKKALS